MNQRVFAGLYFRLVYIVATALALLVTPFPSAFAEEQRHGGLADEIPKEQFHVYLLIGQSNMAGRGKVAEEDRIAQARIYALDAQGHWKPASHPLHFDKPKIAGYGLGIEFAKQMLAQNDAISIGLIPCAVGGTSLKQWSQGGDLYESAIARTQLAAQRGTLKGILWHQGEGDCKESKARTYRKRVSKLIAAFRADLKSPELPFVLGELGHFRIGKKGRSDIVIQQQRSLPVHVSNTACVSAAGLGHVGDGSHFDRAALWEFGGRYAAAMIALQSRIDAK